jgi:hypothetical protein
MSQRDVEAVRRHLRPHQLTGESAELKDLRDLARARRLKDGPSTRSEPWPLTVC